MCGADMEARRQMETFLLSGVGGGDGRLVGSLEEVARQLTQGVPQTSEKPFRWEKQPVKVVGHQETHLSVDMISARKVG